MKFLHTSDWHLGRTLHGADLSDAFAHWCDHVVDVARSRDLDAVLIAGDIFDRGIPPVAMVKLLSDTLEQLAQFTTVVITSGNHDAPTRLGFTAGLLKDRVVIATDPREVGKPVNIYRDKKLVGHVYALPYLDPDVDRVRLAANPDEPLPRSHEAVVSTAMKLVEESIAAELSASDKSADNSDDSELREVPRVVMAHEFVVGGEPSESERDLHIGGVDSVPSAIFDRKVAGKSVIDYVALGHLHGPQRVCEEPLMRYAGSPIAFSFSEENHKKSAVIVSIEKAGDKPEIEIVPAPVDRPLATLRASFAELTSAKYQHYRDYFVRAYVTDVDRPERMIGRLRNAFPYLLEAHHDVPFQQLPAKETALNKTNPVDVLIEFFAGAGGRELNDEERKIITEQWELLQKGEN